MGGVIPLLPYVPLSRGLGNFAFYLVTKHSAGRRYVSLFKKVLTHLEFGRKSDKIELIITAFFQKM